MPANTRTGTNKIDILNDQKKIKGIQELRPVIKKTINTALAFEKVDPKCEISVCLTDNEKIKALNSEFRSIDRPTDVLSFPSGEYPSPASTVFLGDIIISLEKAAEQSSEYGTNLSEEVAFLTAHSVLHLLGYDHMTEEEEKIMFGKQDTIMSLMGFSRKTDSIES